MKTVLNLIKKEYRLFWADRVAVSLTFIIPILLILLWGSIFGNANSGPENLRLAFVNNSHTSVTQRIERVLDTTKTFKLIKSYTDENGKLVVFDESTVKDYIRKGNAAAALVIPTDAYTDTSLGLKLKFYYDPRNEMEMQIIQGVLQQTIMSQLPEVFLQSGQRYALQQLGHDSGNAFNRGIARVISEYFDVDTSRINDIRLDDSTLVGGGGGNNNFFSNVLRLEKEQLVGKEVTNPWAARSVGGWAMMFLLFTMTASSTSLFDEKHHLPRWAPWLGR